MEKAEKQKSTEWTDEAKQELANLWDDPEVIVRCVAYWIEIAAQNERNTDYYRSLVERCGKAIGDRAFIADDGNHSENVLCAKVPEIIEADYANKKELSNL